MGFAWISGVAVPLAVVACAPSVAVAPARAPVAAEPDVAVIAAPAEPAPLPFRMPCGETDFAACSKGCDEKDTGDCVTLATMYYRGKGAAMDRDRAIGMFRIACNDRSPLGCMRLGDAYHDGAVSGDAEQVDAYRRACDAGANRGCVSAGRAYLSGTGVIADASYAARLFDRVCALGNAEACFELGRMNKHGDGIKPNEAKAHDLFEKSCKLGFDAGCVSASDDGEMLPPRD